MQVCILSGEVALHIGTLSDLNAVMAVNATAHLDFTGRNVKFQFGTIYSSYAEGPESQATTAARASFPRTDFNTSEGWLFLEWVNGRISLSSELDWYYSTTRYQRSADGTFNGLPDNADGSGSRFIPRYIESWRFASLFTASSGPFMLQLTYVRMPGPDRSHGIRIDRQPFVQLPQQGASDVFDSFNSIIGSTYSGGLPAFGDVPDAHFLAARIDHSLAANLNTHSGGIATAKRISQGYGWGFIRPDPTSITRIDYNVRGSFLDPSPAIRDNDLGWETGIGIHWKFLEAWSFIMDVNYWRPGRWFNYACVDKSVSNWNIPTPNNNFGINPDRTIDSVMVVNLQLDAKF